MSSQRIISVPKSTKMLDEELDASELGTLEYWEERYESEIINFSRHGDPGEVWFGEDIVRRLVNWISANVDKTLRIADVGCGNGHILIELAHLGYQHLVGLDYSEKAISLAKAVAKKQELPIDYVIKDILNGLDDKFDVVHDKGTYDAISLSENSKESREKYISAVCSAMKDCGYFIITSCNWTESELEDQFKEYFSLFKIIPTPHFKFGGKVGNVVSICVFKKKQ